MEARRRFLKRMLGAMASLGLMTGLTPSAFGRLLAEIKKTVLPKDTERSSLINQNPSRLDASQMEVTPLPDFGVMGLSDHAADAGSWKLEVSGTGLKPVTFSLVRLKEMPSIQRKVLMICPGVFANIGRWKGISIPKLLGAAGYRGDASHATLSGPDGPYVKVKKFPMEEIRSDRVFLAYEVNGEALPQKHGFPLRVVAEGYYGYDWVKYVDRVVLQAP